MELIEASAGALPVPTESLPDLLQDVSRAFPSFASRLIARANRACDGVWTILGHPPAPLGRLPDWQRDFVSGRRWDPKLPSRRQPIVRGDGSDIKIPWEISRLQHLPSVALAFRLTGERRYLDLICDQLSDWIARNPPGLGVNWTCAMDVALRAVSISWAWEIVRRDPRAAADLRARVYWSLFAHGHFLRGHLEDGATFVGNHYVADLLGLIWLGHLYPAFEGARDWRDTGVRRLIDHLARQIHPDGGDREGSIAYHRLVAEMVGLAATVSRAPALRDAFRRMARFTAGILEPDGSAPQLGDNDGGRAFRLLDRAPLDHSYLASWGWSLDGHSGTVADPEVALIVNTGAADSRPRAQGFPPPPAGGDAGAAVLQGREGAFHFPDSRLTAFRQGDLYVLLSATPVGQQGLGGHGHNDKLAIELFLGGPVIADPGSFAYTGDPEARNGFRATAAHATLQVDDLEQNPITADLFHLPERAHARIVRCEREGDVWIWEGEHRGFGPLLHRRTARVDLAGRSVRLLDEITGDESREHSVIARFPLAPGISAHAQGKGFEIRRGDEAILRLDVPGDAHLDIVGGWYSPDYGARVRCQVLEVSLRGRLPLRLAMEISTPSSAG